MKKTFGLLGEKLAHSFSPLIHGYLGAYAYPLYETRPEDLDAFMRARPFDGINVTIPYKQAVAPYCASLSAEARAIGSVNTIVKGADGLLHGHNTDYYGFCALLVHSGINPQGKKTLVLGDGGSAAAVRAALTGLGAGPVVTISRRGEDHYGNIARHEDAAIIVNTTPVGMHPDNESSPLSLAGFSRLAGVVDLIYNPAKTRLVLAAEVLGVPCANGLVMLVAQAEMASRIFLDAAAEPAEQAAVAEQRVLGAEGVAAAARPPGAVAQGAGNAAAQAESTPQALVRPELVEEIVTAIREKTRNIALIGMPGCGKSTVGALLAQRMGRPFADIDEKIEAIAGKSIEAIFAEDGEDAFRRLETCALAEEAKKSGMVIATGGGVVTRPENRELLRQNSLIVYLKRDLSALAAEGRPLSQRTGIQALAAQRLPLYEMWGDVAVEAENTPERTAARILDNNIQSFEDQRIRAVWDEEKSSNKHGDEVT